MNGRHLRIEPPFFEIGPKNYLFGKDILDLAKIADEEASKNEVDVIFTTPYANIAEIASCTKNLYVFAPHMDMTPIGRGLANVLPESIKDAGAKGVMLNHTEKPLSIARIIQTIDRARGLDMITIVCATSILETRAVAQLHPDIIVSEPLELIGNGVAVDASFVKLTMNAVLSVDCNIGTIVAGGVSTGDDVYKIIHAGADATGASSAIALAQDPRKRIREMLAAARQAWDERTQISTDASL